LYNSGVEILNNKLRCITSVITVSMIILLSISVAVAKNNYYSNDDRIIINPINSPPLPIRQPAEFEPMEGVLINYGGDNNFGISYDIIAEMAEDVDVVTIVDSTSQQTYVESLFLNHGVNLDHCSFLISPSNTWWTRDYGPWFIINGDDHQGIIDHVYNRPRPNDDQIPNAYGNWQGIPVYDMNLVHTGGNYMTDGQGTAVSTTLVWNENPGYTHDQIDQIVEDNLGITTYHVVPDALGAYIEHIDCWAKYLAPDVIMIIEVSQSHAHYDDIEDAVDYFENQFSCYGTPYEVVRVYTHLDEPYINSLILNDKVLVPITGSSWDDDAIASYEEAMPGYEVLGFSGSWYSTDALHCRTMGITDRGMLYIEHTPLYGEQSSPSGYDIEAKIIPYSGENIIAGSTQVYWKLEGGEWDSIEMQNIGDDNYIATIPPQQSGETVNYYIHAEDESSRTENHPYTGESDPHSFIVSGSSNDPPFKPTKPDGATSGKPGTKYMYTTDTVDPQTDEVFYIWDWGNDNFSTWLGPYESGETCITSYIWDEKGTYAVRVKAKDIHGLESEWSDPLEVTMPKTFPIWSNIENNFPLIYSFLTKLLGI